MERTHVFLRRHTERIGTVGRENDREEGYFLRSERHMYHRGVSTPTEYKFTCQLLQYPEWQEANAADHVWQTRRKNQQLKSEISSRDKEVQYLEERLEYRRERNIKFGHKLQEKDEQIYDLKDKLQQTKTLLNEKVDALSESIRLLKIKLQYQDREIKEKEQMRQILQKCSDKETELNKHTALQKAEIKSRDNKVRELEITLDNTIIEISQCKELLKNTVEKKDAQFSAQSKKLHQTSAQLQETEAKMSLLKEKNHHLKAEVEHCNDKVKKLEEILDSLQNATNDGNERQAHPVMKQKDEEILDPRHQLKQTMTTLDRKEYEMNKIIASLKKKTKDLENDIKHRDMTNQHLQAEVERCNEKVKNLEKSLDVKRPATNDGDKRQSNTLMSQKDDHISDMRHQLKQTLDRKESEMNEIIASLKKKSQDLENKVEQRDMTNQHLQAEVERYNEKVKNLEKMLDGKRTATNDGDKRQSNTLMRQKDDQISDLRHQLKQTLDRKESEMNETIASLKKKTQDLEIEVELRDMTIKNLRYEKKRNK